MEAPSGPFAASWTDRSMPRPLVRRRWSRSSQGARRARFLALRRCGKPECCSARSRGLRVGAVHSPPPALPGGAWSSPKPRHRSARATPLAFFFSLFSLVGVHGDVILRGRRRGQAASSASSAMRQKVEIHANGVVAITVSRTGLEMCSDADGAWALTMRGPCVATAAAVARTVVLGECRHRRASQVEAWGLPIDSSHRSNEP